MSAKIEINKAVEVIKKHEIEPDTLREIVEEFNLLTQKDADEPTPHEKKQFVILVSDPEGRLPEGCDFAGWVLQIGEAESVLTTQDRINKAAYEFNTTKKGRLRPVHTVGEAIECVPAKHFKEHGVWCKTRTPVLIIKTDNEIPTETKE